MHRLVSRQLAKSTDASGALDIKRLTELVSNAYGDQDRDRRRTDRSMSLMIDEVDAVNRDLEQLVTERTRELRAREADLQSRNMLFEAATSNMSQGLTMFDREMRLVICNQRYVDMYRLAQTDIRAETTLRDLMNLQLANGNFAGDVDQYVANINSTIDRQLALQTVIDMPDGRTILVALEPMSDGGWVSTHEDITERKRAENTILHMSRHDALTGLPNRMMLGEKLQEALAHVERRQRIAVLSLDLDQFKIVNDTLGHSLGDKLLQRVAARLKSCVRETDIVARVDGDEFAIIQTNISGAGDAEELALRISNVVGTAYELDGHTTPITVSIGIALAPDDGDQPIELIKNADIALSGAKADGHGMFRFFEADMDARMKARRTLEIALRKAIANNEFVLHYQPVVHLGRECVKSCEALVRWRHPELGMVSPMDFIPVAEEMGLIVALGEWVIRQACSDAATWPDGIGVAVNLSPSQLASPTLLPTVREALAVTGLPSGRLEMEITEAVLMHDTEVTMQALHQLRSLGISISLDDFGTGYSSLSYLSSFPFDTIKIDRSFIAGLSNKSESAAIIAAVTGLAKSLGMTTTAEGVENRTQLDRVRSLGCTNVQGYFYSKPVAAADLPTVFAGLAAKTTVAA